MESDVNLAQYGHLEGRNSRLGAGIQLRFPSSTCVLRESPDHTRACGKVKQKAGARRWPPPANFAVDYSLDMLKG